MLTFIHLAYSLLTLVPALQSPRRAHFPEWMTSVECDKFYVNMYIFCNLDAEDMTRYEQWYASAWDKFAQKQKQWIEQRLRSNHLQLHHNTTVGYILSSFLRNSTNIITSIRDKQFVFDLFPRFDYFANANSDYFNRGLIHTFKSVINKISSDEVATVAFANLKMYISWINSNFTYNAAALEFNSFADHSRHRDLFSVNIHQPAHCLHGYLQSMFVLKDPVIELHRTPFADFLEFWFRQTGYKFVYHSKNCKACQTAMEGYKQLNLQRHLKKMHVGQEHVHILI